MIPDSAKNFLLKHPIKKLHAEGKIVEYISTGQGKETILLLPGGGQTAQSNFGMIEALENKYKVISPTIYDIDSVNNFCNIINSLLKAEKVNIISIYGLSVGGLMAQSYLFRNQKRVKSLILSHACTPESKLFRNKVVTPLRILRVILPIVPINLVKHLSKTLAGKAQGVTDHTQFSDPWLAIPSNQEKMNYFAQEWFDKYLDKTLLRTWINLDVGFSNERFDAGKIANWPGTMLILYTDNDPLVGVDEKLSKLYSQAKTHLFHGTGHLTFQFQGAKIIELVSELLAK